MGKHKSPLQDEIILNFMKKNPDLAKGFVKGEKISADAKWSDLSTALNAVGPPIKDIAGWKKVWCDWRVSIRRKIAKNKAEARASGGDSYSQQVVTEVEKELAKLCGLYDMVVEAHRSPSTVVLKRDPDDEEETEEVPSLLDSDEEPMPKRRRSNPAAPATLDLQGMCTAQLNVMTQLSSSMTEHFKKIEELHKEDIAIKKQFLSMFNDLLQKFEL